MLRDDTLYTHIHIRMHDDDDDDDDDDDCVGSCMGAWALCLCAMV